MVRKIKINESLKSNEIGTHPRIGVVDGIVYVDDLIEYYSSEYIVNGEYVHINGILSELNKINKDIPNNIAYYEIESFTSNDANDKSYLTLTYRDDDNKFITLKMSLYEAPIFLSKKDLVKFGIEK